MKKGLVVVLGLLLVVVMGGVVSASKHILTYRLPITEMSSKSGAPNCKYIQTDKSEDVIFNNTSVCWNPIDNYFYSVWIWGKITLIIDGVTFKGEELSTYGHLYWNGGDIDSVYKDSISNLQTHLYSNGSSIFVGTIEIQLDDSLGSESDYGVISIDGIIINDVDYEQRISKIELNQSNHEIRISAIENWKTTVNITSNCSGCDLNNITQRIFTLESWKQSISLTIDSIKQWLFFWNYQGAEENVCDAIENECDLDGGTDLGYNYFKYLSSTDRKNVVCGYGAGKNMTRITDLGYDCTITYRYLTSGSRRATCRCTKV